MKSNKHKSWLIVILVAFTCFLFLHNPVETLANANAKSKASVIIVWPDDDITRPVNPEDSSSEPEEEPETSDSEPVKTDDTSSGTPSVNQGGNNQGGGSSGSGSNKKPTGTNRLPQTGEELLAYAGIIGVLLVLGGLVVRQVKKNKQQL